MSRRFPRRRVLALMSLGVAGAGVAGYQLLRGRSAARGGETIPAAPTTPTTPAPVARQGWRAGPDSVQAEEGPATVAIARNGTPAALVDAAVAALGGMGAFVSSGQTVLVKPNIGWDRPPELAANTNPEVVARIVELCLEAGATRVTVMDRTCNDARRCYASSGIQSAAGAAGARVRHADDGRVRSVDLAGAVLGEWDVYEEVLDVDVRINVPVAKHHSLSRVSLGMKNWMGCVGGNRGSMHQEIAPCCVDLAAFFRPQLTVLDAYRVLTANGPSGGRPTDVALAQTVCAGTDPVAVDAFGVSLFDISPDEHELLVQAEERGLGTRHLDTIPTREIDLSDPA